MKIIDFNHPSFEGFIDGEDILVDTGILLAFYNEFDAYFTTVNQLFDKHIFKNDKRLYLYINPTIVNEITHLSLTPLKQFLKSFPEKQKEYSILEISIIEKSITIGMKELIENDVLLTLEGNKESILKQISLYKELGAVDAVNASIANLFGTSFLTVDKRLAENMFKQKRQLSNIKNIYYTTGRNRDYY